MAKQVPLPKEYPIPANWHWDDMGSFVQIKSGFPFDSKRFSSKSEGMRPLIRIRDVLKGETITFTDEDCPEEYIIHAGEILVGMDGDFNIAKWQSEDALLNQRVCCIKSKSELLLDNFLYYYLPSPLKKINDATPSVTVKHLSTKTLNQTPIPLPPLPEQHRIVSRIESLFAKLDEAKEKAQAVVDGFELRKSAILHKAFTGELTERWRKEHGVGLDSWKQCLIGEVFDLQAGKNISAKEISGQQTDLYRYPCFGGNGIRGYVAQFNREGEHPIIGRQGALCGNINLANNRFYATEHAVVVSYKMDISTPWAYHYLKFLNLNQYATATAQPGLAVSNIVKVPIQYVPFEEQRELSEILDNLLNKEQQAKEAAEAVLSRIDTMKKAILARAFRGELGTNDPAEEWAGEMLKAVL